MRSAAGAVSAGFVGRLELEVVVVVVVGSVVTRGGLLGRLRCFV